MDDAFELDPLNLALEALMRLHAKVDTSSTFARERSRMRKRIDSETKARWAREDLRLRRYVEARMEAARARAQQVERRRARLRRLTFGLLGREPLTRQ